MDIFDRLQDLIEERGMTRRKLAQMAGIKPTTLNSAFNRKSDLSAESVSAMAKVLKTTTAYLLHGVGQKQQNNDLHADSPSLNELLGNRSLKNIAELAKRFTVVPPMSEWLRPVVDTMKKFGLRNLDEVEAIYNDYDAFLKDHNMTRESFLEFLFEFPDVLTAMIEHVTSNQAKLKEFRSHIDTEPPTEEYKKDS